MFYFDCKVNVFRGINDVDVMFLELCFYIMLEGGGGCRGNGNIMFLFLDYLVYSCSIVVNFVNFVREVSVE